MKTRCLFIIVILVATIETHAQQKELQTVVDTFYKNQNFNGVVLTATNGKIDFIKAVGLANRKLNVPLTESTKFKIASVTKTFTAVLIMQLAEQKKIDINTTISKYFPAYTGEARNKATIKNLLTYSSGIPNCESYIGDAIYQQPITLDSFIYKYCSGNLESEPGTKFNYDNGDFIVLQKIVELVTGKSFKQNVQDNILIPLHMQNTGMLADSMIVSNLTNSYTYDDSLKTFYNDKPYYIENFFGAGAMYSTAEDLLKFDDGIFNYKLLQKQTVDSMLVPNTSLQNVGIGFWYADAYPPVNEKFVYRPGGIYGSTANWIHTLNSNKTFIILSNTSATNLFQMTQELYKASTAAGRH